MWVDAITEFEPRKRLVAVKNVSLAEEHLHDHFAAEADEPALPVMPNTLILEGMAQTAGILVGSVNAFQEKVILAKIVRAQIEHDVVAGRTIRYDATIERMDEAGASTTGTIEMIDHAVGKWESIGRVDLLFSHIDNNLAGIEFPEHNFVFGENFRTLLRSAGLESVCE